MRKKRILLCNDAHFLYTGYAKYGRQMLERLTDTGKYDLAELACYGKVGDERDIEARWGYYANHVDERHPLYKMFVSSPQNEFGKWRFERTCLDFKPDIVVDIRDPWMSAFEHSSPLRPFYHWVIMPTVDSAPQKDEWLDTFSDADGVFAYSDWGLDVLNTESNHSIHTITSAPPGCDTQMFAPVRDKIAHKRDMGFFADCNIIGTVMRNQGRKLYPDLFIAFKRFLDKCYERGDKTLAEKTYLYVHCSYPDYGWDIPGLLLEHELGHKVIFTYICKVCNNPFCAFFRDARTVCPRCGTTGAILPNTVIGLESAQLAQILNIFDVYIQYSVCEGFGMPQIEAASCGIPIMAVDYSAMADVVRKTGGIPLKVQRMFRDIGTNSYRALPDNEDCAEEIYKFFRKPDAIRRRMGHVARQAVESYYNWERTIGIWESYFDAVQLKDLQGQWDAPKRHFTQAPPIPKNINHTNFIEWCIINVLQEPKLVNSRFAMKYVRQLAYGAQPSERSMIPITPETIYASFRNQLMNKIECEAARVGELELSNIDFIQYAHQRAEYL